MIPPKNKNGSHVFEGYKCDFIGCNKIFFELWRFNKHIRIHRKLFECIHCQTSFGTHYHLQRHLKRSHKIYFKKQKKELLLLENQISHKCQFCDKKFCARSDLQKHINFHHTLMEKQFLCKKCLKRFRTKGNLKEHLQVHLKKEERKMYQCSKCCHVSFTLKTSLTRHLKKFH